MLLEANVPVRENQYFLQHQLFIKEGFFKTKRLRFLRLEKREKKKESKKFVYLKRSLWKSILKVKVECKTNRNIRQKPKPINLRLK